MQVILDLQARMSLLERRHANEMGHMETELRRARRRIAYLERDKQTALERARKATDQARYWQGVCISRRAA
jgi:hypothetical protein